MFACLAKDESDVLPGHIWMSRPQLEVQNMKYMCPRTLQALKSEEATLMDKYSDVQARQLWPIVRQQLPPALAASPEHAPNLRDRLPWEYQKSTVVKSLASRLVYREGLSFVEVMPDARLPAFALAYLEQEQRVRSLADAVAASGQPFAPEVEALLLEGGVRVAAEKVANAAKERNGSQ